MYRTRCTKCYGIGALHNGTTYGAALVDMPRVMEGDITLTVGKCDECDGTGVVETEECPECGQGPLRTPESCKECPVLECLRFNASGGCHAHRTTMACDACLWRHHTRGES